MEETSLNNFFKIPKNLNQENIEKYASDRNKATLELAKMDGVEGFLNRLKEFLNDEPLGNLMDVSIYYKGINVFTQSQRKGFVMREQTDYFSSSEE